MEVKLKIFTLENLRRGQHQLAVVKKESFDIHRGNVLSYDVLADNFNCFSCSSQSEAEDLQKEITWDSLQLNFSFFALGILKYYEQSSPHDRLILLVNPMDYEQGVYDDLAL